MSWIISAVDQNIALNLKPYKTSKEMWECLKKVYNQDNAAKRFQIEYDISNYSQGTIYIQEYYSGFQNLWAEFTDIAYAKVPVTSLLSVQQVHEQSKRDRFLMKLRPEFEVTRSNLMNRASTPSLDEYFSELLREEQRLATQSAIQACPISYCRKPGHIIKECRTRPQNRQSNVGQAVIGNQAVVGSVTAEKSTLTPEMV
ncbi:uncharacterized protein LOC141715249 [Apium graveolens]|uniref:uncharacterized protein LOC141715249 n=1 Tax=Apium graveolens TaxID=4045 RepID=UPI003D7BB94F